MQAEISVLRFRCFEKTLKLNVKFSFLKFSLQKGAFYKHTRRLRNLKSETYLFAHTGEVTQTFHILKVKDQ